MRRRNPQLGITTGIAKRSKSLLDLEDVLTLQEYLGFCLIPSTRAQTALFIIGNGGEGKSRISVVINAIFGSAMLSGNFQRVEDDKFFRYNLINKLLMNDDDMQMNALKRETFINWLKSNADKYNIRYPNNIYENGKRVRGFEGISLKS